MQALELYDYDQTVSSVSYLLILKITIKYMILVLRKPGLSHVAVYKASLEHLALKAGCQVAYSNTDYVGLEWAQESSFLINTPTNSNADCWTTIFKKHTVRGQQNPILLRTPLYPLRLTITSLQKEVFHSGKGTGDKASLLFPRTAASCQYLWNHSGLNPPFWIQNFFIDSWLD